MTIPGTPVPAAAAWPARLPVYYGWVMVSAAFVEGAFSTGIGVWGLGVFITPMEQELGWSRSTFFFALTIRALLGGVLGPIVGPWQDTRWGPRLMNTGGSILLGLSLIGLKWVHEAWQFHLLYGALGAVASMGSGQMLTSTIIPKWFVRQRGRAIALASTGTGVGPLLFPLTTHWAIVSFGWRDAWVVLGIVTLVVLVPISLLVRTRPEDVGLLPDGDSSTGPRPGRSRGAARADHSFTQGQALRTTAFWVILLSTGISALGVGGFQSNLIPYFEQRGIPTATATVAITVYGICSMSARLMWGVLSERLTIRYALVIQGLLTAASMLVLLQVRSVPLMFGFAAFHGATLGGYFILRPLMMADYFGRAHLGAVNGIMRPFMTVTGAVSPLLVAGLYDARGDYNLAFTVVMLAWAASAIAVWFARPPRVPSPEAVVPSG